MPPKKKDAKNEKGKAPSAGGTTVAEVTNEQLQEQIDLLKQELDKEREERNFFQMERDKIQAFWDITKRQLEERTSDLRNKDRELEELEENHQAEVKDYKQKVKHLLYEHQNSLSEQKAARTTAKKVLQTEHIEREFELRKEIRSLKTQLKEMELASENLVKKLKLKTDEEIIQMQNDFERQLLENKGKYDHKNSVMQKDLNLRWTNEIHKIEERKNSQINTLMKDHEKAFANMRSYYNDAIINNMALINSQKAELDATLKKVEELEKENGKLILQNKRLVEPLQKAKEEVAELQKQAAHGKKDKASLAETRARLKAAEKEVEDLKWEYEVLQQSFCKVQEDRDQLANKFTKTILEVQQKNSFKNQLEKKLNVLSKSGEREDIS